VIVVEPFFYQFCRRTTPDAVLLHGPRGVGKTQYFLRQARETGGFYLSMDHPIPESASLYEWVSELFSRGERCVYLDEIHHIPDWSIQLKSLHDAYPGNTIRVSGSNSLLMNRGLGDLSRRFLSTPMPFISFREYLFLRTGHEIDPINPFTDVEDAHHLIAEINILKHFETYLQTGPADDTEDTGSGYPVSRLSVVSESPSSHERGTRISGNQSGTDRTGQFPVP